MKQLDGGLLFILFKIFVSIESQQLYNHLVWIGKFHIAARYHLFNFWAIAFPAIGAAAISALSRRYFHFKSCFIDGYMFSDIGFGEQRFVIIILICQALADVIGLMFITTFPSTS